MHGALDRATMEATVHLLVAGFVLIGAGLAGVGGSTALVGLLLAVTVVLAAVRGFVPSLGTYGGVELRYLVADAWIATALAATTVAMALGATPGETQSLGGLLGLVAMANYFLRPVYHVAYSFVTDARDDTRPEKH